MDLFDGLGKAEVSRMIADARLRERDAQIAYLRLVERKHFIEIGAEVGCDRRTAARHYRSAVDLLSNTK